MEFIKALILGIVQGLTEFLPISSSGHLVIGAELLHFKEQGLTFDIFLHLGTLVSVLLVFRNEIKAMISAPFLYLAGSRDRDVIQSLLWDFFVIIATIPAVIVGLFLKDRIEAVFTSLSVVFTMLAFTGLIMIGTRFLSEGRRPVDAPRSFIIGCAQAFAILPGLSRSGSTIFTGMLLGVDRQVAARFSFIMSIPAILGAVVLQISDISMKTLDAGGLLQIALGTLASAVSGYFAIVLLLDIVKKNRLQWFGYYCLMLSIGGFFLLYLH